MTACMCSCCRSVLLLFCPSYADAAAAACQRLRSRSRFLAGRTTLNTWSQLCARCASTGLAASLIHIKTSGRGSLVATAHLVGHWKYVRSGGIVVCPSAVSSVPFRLPVVGSAGEYYTCHAGATNFTRCMCGRCVCLAVVRCWLL